MLIRILSLLVLLVLLSGCAEQMELHRNLTEQEANEVLAELASKGVDARKRLDKSGAAVLVASSDISRAVRVLGAVGLPRASRSSLGEVFRKEGVISSPLEERARYIYALSQELEQTLSQIDGVVVARVHVVLPERVAPGEPVTPASAAVFIKHVVTLDPDSILPRIRRMVASSIPGVAGDQDKKLAVVFMPAQVYEYVAEPIQVGPFLVSRERLRQWKWIAGTALLSLLIAVIVALMLSPSLRGRLRGLLVTYREGIK